MSGTFAPKVGRVTMHYDGYLHATNASYMMQALIDIANGLVDTGEGWSLVHSSVYSSTYMCWAVLEKTVSTEKAQIVLCYLTNVAYIHANNRFSAHDIMNRLWLAYKPSTTGLDINWSSYDPVDANFISDGNGFKFAPVGSYNYYLYNKEHRWCWLVDGERVILINEPNGMHLPETMAIMGPDLVSALYNTGSGKWTGGSPVSHPSPDVHPELFAVWYRPDWDFKAPNSLQWYDTTHGWQGTYAEGISSRGGAAWFPTSNITDPDSPYSVTRVKEPLVVYDSDTTVWLTKNGLKGTIDPGMIGVINSGDLRPYERLESSNFINVRDGLCVGWDSSYGPMPSV